jgi:hypothetical protein
LKKGCILPQGCGMVAPSIWAETSYHLFFDCV